MTVKLLQTFWGVTWYGTQLWVSLKSRKKSYLVVLKYAYWTKQVSMAKFCAKKMVQNSPQPQP